MYINYLKPILFFIPLLLLQLIVVPLIAIDGHVPNLIIVLIAYYTLMGGQEFGTVLGFVLGLLFDIFSGGILGASMLAFTLSGFICGYFFNENKIDTNVASYFFLAILFLVNMVFWFIFSIVSNFNPEVSFLVLIFNETLIPSIYTTVFGFSVVIFQARKLNR